MFHKSSVTWSIQSCARRAMPSVFGSTSRIGGAHGGGARRFAGVEPHRHHVADRVQTPRPVQHGVLGTAEPRADRRPWPRRLPWPGRRRAAASLPMGSCRGQNARASLCETITDAGLPNLEFAALQQGNAERFKERRRGRVDVHGLAGVRPAGRAQLDGGAVEQGEAFGESHGPHAGERLHALGDSQQVAPRPSATSSSRERTAGQSRPSAADSRDRPAACGFRPGQTARRPPAAPCSWPPGR